MEDRFHATEVCSIIVDGPTLNPNLDDGCGRFKVALFPVAIKGKNSSVSIMKAIKKIVTSHKEIHVWNLSLGEIEQISDNFVSPVASVLDEIQAENPGTLFVVAGTNTSPNRPQNRKIGSPADSINSLVVNSVTFSQVPAAYSRHGPALSFYRKPDIAYYGGESETNGIRAVCCLENEVQVCGTSFAAPWIARKAAFLIDKMQMSREEAKALLIDSSLKNNPFNCGPEYIGFGVVPISIRDVIEPASDEIRFLIKGVCETYYTYTYNIPIPTVDDRFPFKARVVLATALHCDRNKGVDYSNEEIGISYGRMKDGKIKTINGDKQELQDSFITEGNARLLYRKWDNIKVVEEEVRGRRVGAKKYSNFWGLRISSKIRNNKDGRPKTNFAAVITMTEIYGQDRSEAFESLCVARGWIVERINVEAALKLYNIASEEIEWK